MRFFRPRKKFFKRKNLIRVLIVKLFQMSLLTPANAGVAHTATVNSYFEHLVQQTDHSFLKAECAYSTKKKSTYTTQFLVTATQR